jgi:hypothetical protein
LKLPGKLPAHSGVQNIRYGYSWPGYRGRACDTQARDERCFDAAGDERAEDSGGVGKGATQQRQRSRHRERGTHSVQ